MRVALVEPIGPTGFSSISIVDTPNDRIADCIDNNDFNVVANVPDEFAAVHNSNVKETLALHGWGDLDVYTVTERGTMPALLV